MKRKIFSILLVLVLVLSFSLVTAVPVAAATINVPGDYATIQEAIDAAGPGDTITVDANTYTEDLTIDESVTIQGAGSGTTTITGAHTVSVSNVSLTGFTLTLSGSGIVVKIDSSSAALSNISVTDCVLNMSTSPSIGVSIGYGIGSSPNAVSNVTMDGNTFNGPTNDIANPWKIGGEFGSPVGIQVTNVDFTDSTVNDCSIPINLHDQNITDILIDGNTFSSTDGAVYVWEDADSPTGVLSQFVFTNNDLSAANSYGVGIDTHGKFTDANFGTGNAIHYNDFGGCATTYGFGAVSILATLTTYTLDAEDNYWGTASGPTHEGNTFNTYDQGAEVSDDVDYVPWYDTDMTAASFAPVTSEDGDFSSIQAAIDAATSTTVTCKAGVYEEDLYIAKSLTVQSEEGAEETEILDWVEIDLGWDGEDPLAETVVFDGFYICEAEVLIYLAEVNNGSSVTISNNILDSCAVAIYSGEFTVDNGSSVTIEENYIFYSEWAGICFETVAGDSEVTIRDNVVAENNYGVEFYNVDESTVTIAGNTIGEWYSEEWDYYFSGNYYGGIYFYGLTTVSDSTITIGGDIRAEGNVIVGNGLDEGGDGGILVEYMVASSLEILNNDILDNYYYGVDIWSFDEDSTVDIHLNSIAGNNYGVNYDSPYLIDATCNWWGDIAGPSIWTNPYDGWTVGDSISWDVAYVPWLIQSDLAEDWNIWSRPIAPDEDSWLQMQAELVEDGILDIYYFDSATQLWGFNPDDAGPLDAFYIKMPAESRIRYCLSDEATYPGVKEMAVGWNFIGLTELYGMYLDDALYDAYWGTGQTELIGYSRVISPFLNEDSWSYQRFDEPEYMESVKGYWVFMVNDGTLGGFTSTPIVEVENGP